MLTMISFQIYSLLLILSVYHVCSQLLLFQPIHTSYLIIAMSVTNKTRWLLTPERILPVPLVISHNMSSGKFNLLTFLPFQIYTMGTNTNMYSTWT